MPLEVDVDVGSRDQDEFTAGLRAVQVGVEDVVARRVDHVGKRIDDGLGERNGWA